MKENVIGNTLKKLREKAGYSIEKLSEMIGCAINLIIQWENGENEPEIRQWLVLSKLYNMPIEEMLSEVSVDSLIDNEIKEEFYHEAWMNRYLNREVCF